MINIKEATTKSDIQKIANLANTIWNEYYVPIIGSKQVDYMVEKFQSAYAIEKQINEKYNYFLVEHSNNFAGYFAILIDERESSVFLSKLYIHKDFRSHGIGKTCVSYIEKICREQKLDKIWLTVNKYNEAAIAAYKKIGFTCTAAITQDIGNGFIMDDYKMEKSI